MLVSPIRAAVIVAGSNVYGTVSPPPPSTKNFVLSVFHPLVTVNVGEAQKRPRRSGRVLSSVTRSIFEPNVGSLKVKPAAPSCGSGGFGYVLRSVIAL